MPPTSPPRASEPPASPHVRPHPHVPVRRRLQVRRSVAAPPAVVWDLLVSVAHWPEWGPSVRAVELDGAQIRLGSRGVVHTVGGVRLPFEVTRFDDGRYWSWSVAGVPATDHWVEGEAGGTRVGFGVPWAAAPYLAVCQVALRRLEQLAVRQARA